MSDTPKPGAGHRDPVLPQDSSGPVVAVIRLRARPGQTETAERALLKIVDPIRANPDCVEFRILRDRHDAHVFTLLEHWVSLEATVAHGKRDYMAEYAAAKNDIFEDIAPSLVEEVHPAAAVEQQAR
ncbi:putative quinol monooxygenase [Streptomyces malaysiensis]|uniref:putative quinol monooxygenase n=1 Tax=Streptomyces malaysiensis TaxID=92644 RepID=UPI002B2F3D4E|nr:putative quinol monooxygenase [Streptomyces malaysiensis]